MGDTRVRGILYRVVWQWRRLNRFGSVPWSISSRRRATRGRGVHRRERRTPARRLDTQNKLTAFRLSVLPSSPDHKPNNPRVPSSLLSSIACTGTNTNRRSSASNFYLGGRPATFGKTIITLGSRALAFPSHTFNLFAILPSSLPVHMYVLLPTNTWDSYPR